MRREEKKSQREMEMDRNFAIRTSQFADYVSKSLCTKNRQDCRGGTSVYTGTQTQTYTITQTQKHAHGHAHSHTHVHMDTHANTRTYHAHDLAEVTWH